MLFVVVLRTGVRGCLFVSCIPPSSTTSSENVGVGAIVTREPFLSADFGAKTTDSFGGSAFSKSADSPI